MFSTSSIGSENECIKVYDPEKKELISTLNTYKDAVKLLGLSDGVIKAAALSKTRRFSPHLNKEVAIRIGLKK
jgi:hypothetical protein